MKSRLLRLAAALTIAATALAGLTAVIDDATAPQDTTWGADAPQDTTWNAPQSDTTW